jgi:membrane protein
VEVFVFNNFVLTLGEEIRGHFVKFVENASKITPVGIAVIMVVALLLISSIDYTLNHIWRVRKNRRLVVFFSVYLVVLTLGPVLIGISLITSSYLLSLSCIGENELQTVRILLLATLPYRASFLSFLLLYLLVPNTRVHFRSALSGALIAAILFELSKYAFALYFTHFPVYQAIYGVLAIIPLLFIWVFVSWVVILVGAQVEAILDVFLANQRNIVNQELESTHT